VIGPEASALDQQRLVEAFRSLDFEDYSSPGPSPTTNVEGTPGSPSTVSPTIP
jgi:hypothetical protein